MITSPYPWHLNIPQSRVLLPRRTPGAAAAPSTNDQGISDRPAPPATAAAEPL